MNRLIQAEDINILAKLWADIFGDSEDFAKMIFKDFSSVKNAYVTEENGEIICMICTVPVTIENKKGSYIYGVFTKQNARRQGKAKQLMEYVAQQLMAKGQEFFVLVPSEKELFAFYEKLGFTSAFPLRKFKREINRNIWAQAEFDSVTAKALLEFRKRFAPKAVTFELPQMMAVFSDLYSIGITIVHNKNGYGLYTRKDKTLHFIELQAENEREAITLLEAAREKEVFAEEAEISLGNSQILFLGLGMQEPYGMIKFLGEPFDVTESYMRLMMDDK